jgi:hypothetical protein
LGKREGLRVVKGDKGDGWEKEGMVKGVMGGYGWGKGKGYG